MTLTILALVAALGGGLAIYTAVAVRGIERAHPPAGRFVEVDGGRLHLLELGPAGAPAVVLLHGASGNLLDTRVALGDRLAARYRVIMIDRPGHGWSDRPDGAADASPARQAALIHQALQRIGVTRAIVVGHSWSGALATAYTLAYPEAVSGLLLLAPVTHPWPGGVGWYNPIVTTRIAGWLFTHILALPIGKLLLKPAINVVFAPQQPPPDYAERAAAEMILRPDELTANAEDLVQLKAFIIAQSPHYGEIQTPTIVIAGDRDRTVSPDIHARQIAAMLPHGKLIMLPGVGHMLHHAAPDVVVTAVDELAAGAVARSELASSPRPRDTGE